MELSIKSVILYDPYQHVVGFVEFKSFGDATEIRTRHNLAERDLAVHITADGASHTIPIGASGDHTTHIKAAIDLTREIVAVIMQKHASGVTTLASGSINLGKATAGGASAATFRSGLGQILKDTERTPVNRGGAVGDVVGGPGGVVKSAATREIDEILRAICACESDGKGVCEMCPYRDFFFGESKVDARASIQELPAVRVQ